MPVPMEVPTEAVTMEAATEVDAIEAEYTYTEEPAKFESKVRENFHAKHETR